MSTPPTPGVVFSAGYPQHALGAGLDHALLLDRDGVINVNHGYVHTPQETTWLPGIFELCASAQTAGYGLIVVTNQAGIARGYYDEAQFRVYTQWVHAQFAARGVPLLATYFCPHHPQAALDAYRCACSCRKPQPGMMLAALRDFALQPERCVLIGDQPSDQQAGRAAGIARSWLLDDLPSRLDLFARRP